MYGQPNVENSRTFQGTFGPLLFFQDFSSSGKDCRFFKVSRTGKNPDSNSSRVVNG